MPEERETTKVPLTKEVAPGIVLPSSPKYATEDDEVENVAAAAVAQKTEEVEAQTASNRDRPVQGRD